MPPVTPPLSTNDLAVALQEIDALPIDGASKRELKNIVRSLANPDSRKLETIIRTLPKERQQQIMRIFEEIAARHQQQSNDALKALLLLGFISLGGLISAYVTTDTDQGLQAAQLLTIMKRAYVQGIQDEIDYCGCNARAQEPSGEQLAHLQEMADSDVESIMQTFQADATKELTRLYEENPTASRQFFVESMRAWADRRIAKKALFIAFNTETRAREYGRAEFAKHNYPESALYSFKGAAPVCADCMRLRAMGPVSYEVTLQYPNPQHPRCEHYWQLVHKPKIDCGNLWAG